MTSRPTFDEYRTFMCCSYGPLVAIRLAFDLRETATKCLTLRTGARLFIWLIQKEMHMNPANPVRVQNRYDALGREKAMEFELVVHSFKINLDEWVYYSHKDRNRGFSTVSQTGSTHNLPPLPPKNINNKPKLTFCFPKGAYPHPRFPDDRFFVAPSCSFTFTTLELLLCVKAE